MHSRDCGLLVSSHVVPLVLTLVAENPQQEAGPVNMRFLASVCEGLTYLHFLVRICSRHTLQYTSYVGVLTNPDPQAFTWLTAHPKA